MNDLLTTEMLRDVTLVLIGATAGLLGSWQQHRWTIRREDRYRFQQAQKDLYVRMMGVMRCMFRASDDLLDFQRAADSAPSTSSELELRSRLKKSLREFRPLVDEALLIAPEEILTKAVAVQTAALLQLDGIDDYENVGSVHMNRDRFSVAVRKELGLLDRKP